MTKFLQVNLGNGKHAQDLLIHNLLQNSIDIAIISEHYRRVESEIWIEDKTKRAAIIVMNRNIKVSEICEENEGFVYATINGVRIYSCYYPPSMDINQFEEQINKLEMSIRSSKGRIIVAGDFNSKSSEWYSKILDKRGKCIGELIASLGLIVCNNGTSPTFRGTRGNSIIDVTFGSPNLYSETMDWKVLEDITLSDHQYITFNINYRISEQNMVINLPKWNIRKLNITKFKNTIQRAKQMTNLTSIAADNMIVIVTEIIIQCCTSSMPKVKEYNRRREPAYWWNSNIKRLRAECLYARRRATRNRSDETLALEYRKSRKKLRLAIKNSKKGKWRELCESVDSDPWGKPYKIITKIMCGRKPIPGINEPKWAKQIVTTLFPTETQKHFNNCKMTTGNNFNPFSNEELMKASKKLKIGKSPGPDGIPNEALKLTVQFWPELLLDTYNTCFKNGIFPKCW